MSLIPPSLSLTVDTKRRACVLDIQLALSTYGLLLAQRLSSELDLWLVRELWQILDNTGYYLSRPTSLASRRLGDAGLARSREDSEDGGLRRILRQWELARSETDLAGLKIYWLGDALSESLLPTGADPHVVHRFEILACALDRRVHRSRALAGQEDVLADCFRDAAALNAALTRNRSFILSQVRPGETGADAPEPLICSYLRTWGVHCCRVEPGPRTEIERELIRPILARTGVSEFMWAGLKLSAVHVLAPHAVVIPSPQEGDASVGEDYPEVADDDDPSQTDWWKGAAAFWYPLGYD
jgi:hypothetical protein